MVLVLFAEGFEEIEGLTVVDLLRRVDIDVMMVGVGSKTVTGSHAIKVDCDLLLTEELLKSDFEALVLPGGMPGTTNLEKSDLVIKLIGKAVEDEVLLAAICAAPSVLGKLGLLKGREATAYPGFEKYLEGAVLSKENVCLDENILTGKGMGCSIDFSLRIVEYFTSREKALKLRESLQCQ